MIEQWRRLVMVVVVVVGDRDKEDNCSCKEGGA